MMMSVTCSFIWWVPSTGVLPSFSSFSSTHHSRVFLMRLRTLWSPNWQQVLKSLRSPATNISIEFKADHWNLLWLSALPKSNHLLLLSVIDCSHGEKFQLPKNGAFPQVLTAFVTLLFLDNGVEIDGSPLLLIHSVQQHTRNLQSRDRLRRKLSRIDRYPV